MPIRTVTWRCPWWLYRMGSWFILPTELCGPLNSISYASGYDLYEVADPETPINEMDWQSRIPLNDPFVSEVSMTLADSEYRTMIRAYDDAGEISSDGDVYRARAFTNAQMSADDSPPFVSDICAGENKNLHESFERIGTRAFLSCYVTSDGVYARLGDGTDSGAESGPNKGGRWVVLDVAMTPLPSSPTDDTQGHLFVLVGTGLVHGNQGPTFFGYGQEQPSAPL